MDRRIAFRLAIVVAGMFLADDRRTASAWFVAAGVQEDGDRFYDCLIGVGRTSGKLATVVLGLVVQKFAGDRILLGMDDSPTSRYGRHVERAGVHHDPTSGPAGGEWLFGHNWVALAWLARHPLWGVIALPHAGRSKNTSTTSKKSGARDSNRSATCGRTLAAGT
jgi:hypothetical protein